MSLLQHALDLAEKGFHVFPLRANSKLPLIEDFPNQATTNPERIRQWWIDPVMGMEQNYNVGISTSRYSHGALVVIDVDNKGDKKGDDVIFELEMKGIEFPRTFTQVTPTGGKHLVYWHSEGLKQNTNTFGKGLDSRSRGGYIVGAGSIIDGKEYKIADDTKIYPATEWIVNKCGVAPEKKKKIHPEIKTTEAAIERVIFYLENEAPLAEEGNAGDQTTYKVAARCKDLGIDQITCAELMDEHWNNRCSPPWDTTSLVEKIENAYRYGNEEVGSSSPELQFKPVGEEVIDAEQLSYLQKMNKEYALVFTEGGHSILMETIDEKGRPKRTFLPEHTFKRKFSPYTIQKNSTYAEEWLDWKGRREYQGLCFAPEREARNGYYNLWRGFTCPSIPYGQGTKEAQRGLDLFLAHARENVCRGDNELFTWLMGYFAHMVQRPYERPLTTLVFKGSKGTGKNALIDRIGNLMGSGHYLVAHDGRYLTSNFNAHFDSCLCLVLDEAFWSGDKSAEGKLKGLTTSPEIMIERKGREPYSVDNLVRIIIIGNERWLVPASSDERRYAVLDIGEGRKQDNEYFREMRELIDDRGGNCLLLHYLKSFDLSTVDVNTAPKTSALLDQKVSSLEPFQQWWFDCLNSGNLVGSDFGEDWTSDVEKARFRSALGRYCKDKQIRSRMPDDRSIGKLLKSVCPTVHSTKKREGSETFNIYRLPSLEDARKDFDAYMGQKINWE